MDVQAYKTKQEGEELKREIDRIANKFRALLLIGGMSPTVIFGLLILLPLPSETKTWGFIISLVGYAVWVNILWRCLQHRYQKTVASLRLKFTKQNKEELAEIS